MLDEVNGIHTSREDLGMGLALKGFWKSLAAGPLMATPASCPGLCQPPYGAWLTNQVLVQDRHICLLDEGFLFSSSSSSSSSSSGSSGGSSSSSGSSSSGGSTSSSGSSSHPKQYQCTEAVPLSLTGTNWEPSWSKKHQCNQIAKDTAQLQRAEPGGALQERGAARTGPDSTAGSEAAAGSFTGSYCFPGSGSHLLSHLADSFRVPVTVELFSTGLFSLSATRAVNFSCDRQEIQLPNSNDADPETARQAEAPSLLTKIR
ncbi:MAG: hypothetical protein FRX49_07153 [Trebouxia sp. A1-2]|nr:MAG: hypothetical protein FRX49_07153 [Trebouxia sp. A1-2]